MKSQGRRLAPLIILPVLAASFLLPGCTTKKRALFTQPQLFNYHRLAVLGLTPEQEQVFMAHYLNTFSGRMLTFVERRRLDDIIGEQDLRPGRLDQATRAKIRKIHGVEALVLCEFGAQQGSETKRKKLRVRIVDTENGVIVGSVLTENYSRFDDHALAAVKALKGDLLSARHHGR